MNFIFHLLLNVSIFLVSFILSTRFLTSSLFREQEIKVKVNVWIFSATFGVCMLMLSLFLQGVLELHDQQTSYIMWKIMFILMDLDLFLIVPLAIVWDLFVKKQEENARQNYRNSGLYIKRKILMWIM